jgi:hypothetical protein
MIIKSAGANGKPCPLALMNIVNLQIHWNLDLPANVGKIRAITNHYNQQWRIGIWQWRNYVCHGFHNVYAFELLEISVFAIWMNQQGALFSLILFWCPIIYMLLLIVFWFSFSCFVLISCDNGKGEKDHHVIAILFLFSQCRWWKSIGTTHTFNKVVF